MFKNNKPIFEAGKILKIEMLENLRDFSRDFIDIKYKDYSDGIIEGCTIEVDDKHISVSDGIVKFNGKIYILKGKESLTYECNNKYVMLKIRFKDIKRDMYFEENTSTIVLDDNLNLNINEMEICRFKLREGARLRNEHIDFTDLSTEFDTVNIIHTNCASKGDSSLLPIITLTFAREMLNFNIDNALDISFLLLCVQNDEPIKRELIMKYIKSKMEVANRYYSNMEIYQYLLQILNTTKNTNGQSSSTGRGKHRKILLD